MKHRLVHAGSPVELADHLELGLGGAPVHRLHGAGVPAVDVSGGDEHLGVGVCLNQLFREGHGGPIAHGLAVAQQLVPLLAAEGALAVVLGREGIGPHQAVGRVLDGGGHHVVAVVEAEFCESATEGC